MLFFTLRDWLGERACAQCSRCDRELFFGEEIWRCNGETVCPDCFISFAHEQLSPFHTILGEEEPL